MVYQNFNSGLWGMVWLSAQEYYRSYLHLDPADMASFKSMISIVWSGKIIYGFISDNFPIFGSKRKSYICIMGVIQFISMFIIYGFQIKDGLAVTLLLATASFSIGFSSVVSDAITINQARRDPVNGS